MQVQVVVIGEAILSLGFKEDIGIYKNTKFKYDDSNKISQSKLTNIIEFLGRFSVVVNEDSISST